MSSSSQTRNFGKLTRRSVLFGAAASVSACGFSPVYGPKGEAGKLRNSILIDDPKSRNDFDFVAQFEERLGRAEIPRYKVFYTITTRAVGVGITPKGETTRFNLFGVVRFNLVDAETDEVLVESFVENFTGYSATSLTMSNRSVTKDANERLMTLLANQVVARLIATASDWEE